MFALIYNIISSFKIINIGKGMYRPLIMKLRFGFPDFNGKKEMLDAGPDADPEKKLSLKSLLALVATGAGSPFLGDFKGVDEDSGTLNFELDANNLGKQASEPCGRRVRSSVRNCHNMASSTTELTHSTIFVHSCSRAFAVDENGERANAS